MANLSSSMEWILGSSASYHMGSSKGDFSSLKQSQVPHIFMRDDKKKEVEGKGHVEMENGEFIDVLYVPNLSCNLLSIYQIAHLRDGHEVEFLPNSVIAHSLIDDSLVPVGKVNDDKRLYEDFTWLIKGSL